jgi:flagellar motor switch protein FliN/FliY
MTEAADSARQADAAAFVHVWAEALSQVLGQITSTQVPCLSLSAAPPQLSPAADADQWIACACSGAVRGEMSLRLNPAVVLGFAQVFMSEPAAPEAELTSDHREAVVELFRQVAGLAATSAKPRWGEIKLQMETSPGAPSWAASSTSWLQAGKEETADALVEMHLSAALVAALRQENRTEAVTAPAPAPVETPPPPLSALADEQNKLALLMDVELAMTLRFGARRMLLREILDLCPGAVVELDRQVKDPVELLLDGRLVARGEVVVIEGNYGLRVTEVLSAGSNLRDVQSPG